MWKSTPWRIITGHYYAHNHVGDEGRAVYGDVRDIYNISSDGEKQSFFRVLDYEKQKDRNSKRIQGTCGWVLRNQIFDVWLKSPRGSILWVTAYPGCGKSVLSRTLVDEAELLGNDQSLVLYFFFSDNQEQRTVSSALCSLLHQLFRFRPQLFKKHAQFALTEDGDSLKTDFHPAWDLFLKAVTDSEVGPILCVLDGLDECDQEDRRALLNKLRDEYDSRSTQSSEEFKLRFFITSRPSRDVEWRIAKFSNKFLFRIRDEDCRQILSQDIERVAEEKVRGLRESKGFSSEIERRILAKLLENDQRTFLWITLMCRELLTRTEIDEEDWLASVENLPKTVDERYETFLTECHDRSKALAILGIVIGSMRPLRLDELCVALPIYLANREGKPTNDLKPLREEATKKAVQDLCGFFLTVFPAPDSRVLPFHHTVIEFLIQSDDDDDNAEQGSTVKWRNSLNQRKCHRTLAEICMRALISIELKPKSESSSDSLAHGGIKLNRLQETVKRLDSTKSGIANFLDYASSFWADHFRLAEFESNDPLVDLARELCKVDSDCYSVWFKIYWWRITGRGNKTGRFTDLGVATFLGLRTLVRRMLCDGADVDGDCGEFGFPLYVAAWMGNKEMVQLLLEERADINQVNGSNGNALYAALTNRKNDVVFLLLEAGAQVNQRGGIYGTVLTSAAVKGDEEVVEALLAKNADIGATCTTKEAYFPDALSAALWQNHESIVRKLLDRGAQIAHHDYGSALHAACFNNQEGLIRLFLERNPGIINMRGGELGYPLQAAAWRGSAAIVEMLLKHGAKIDAQGGYFGTALQAASYRGSEDIVRLLLKEGAKQLDGGEFFCPTMAAAANDKLHIKAILDAHREQATVE